MKYTKHCKTFVSLRYLYCALGLFEVLIAALSTSPAPIRAALNPVLRAPFLLRPVQGQRNWKSATVLNQF
jgi:hypothetical protein